MDTVKFIEWFFAFVFVGFFSLRVLNFAIPYMPFFVQRPFYRLWKKKLIKMTAKADAWIAYPMLAFIEFNLDSVFKKGGMRAVKQALEHEVTKIGDNIKKAFKATPDKIITAKGLK